MFKQIYSLLLEAYGKQGWFPLIDCDGCNPTKTGSINGYHPGDYSYPKNSKQKFEICVGLILTQNTGWVQVEKALLNLDELNLIDPSKILEVDAEILKDAIKPAGYFNQKAKKLVEFSTFFIENVNFSREDLLNVWGIGPETADSILLYAYHMPIFVIDAYTKRIFNRLGVEFGDYNSLQKLFHDNLDSDYTLFNEYHALIVEHAKKSCKAKPECEDCVLSEVCSKNFNKF